MMVAIVQSEYESPGIQANRDASLDAARGVLMSMGIVLHAAKVYSPKMDWLVSDSANSQVFYLIATAIHSFRMEAFFWISGFFCALTIKRYGDTAFLRKRIPRLAIPLIVAWGTLNVMQVIIVGAFGGLSAYAAVRGGIPLFHLWFLVDLMIFFFIASGIGYRRFEKLGKLGDKFSVSHVMPILLIFVLALMAVGLSLIVRASGVAYVDLGVTSLYRLSKYFPFFIVGALMFVSNHLRLQFMKIHPVFFFLGVFASVLLKEMPDGASLISRLSIELTGAAATWISVASLLGFFGRVLTKQGKFSAFISGASYTIYIFHHGLVVLIATILLPMPWSTAGKFIFVVISVFGVCAILHKKIILKYSLLRLAFNGKR